MGQTIIQQPGGSAGGGGGAPTDAQYVCMALNGTLSAERVLTGTTNKIGITDGGANGNVTLNTGSLVVHTDQANTWTAGAQSMSAAASLIVPVAANAAPTAQGDIRYDSTLDIGKIGGRGSITGAISRTLSVQFSTTDSLTAATIGTTETAFATTFAIPANFFTANKILRVIAGFDITSSASPPTHVLKLRVQKAGPTNVNLYASVAAAPAASLTNIGVGIQWLIQGTAAVGVSVNVETASLVPSAATIIGTARNTVAQGVAIDTTAAQTLQLTLTYGANTAGNTVILRQLVVEEMY